MTDTAPTIHTLLGRVLAELPAIGKNSYNEQQKFSFRGIDDVMNALNPLLAKHGVFFVPHVLERVDSERATRNGSAMYVVNLHVQYRFYGPAGDYVEASGWGEGTDMGDKATNKAMTGAMKYVLFQTFAISTQEAAENDADRDQVEETAGTQRPPARVAAPRQERSGARSPSASTDGADDDPHAMTAGQNRMLHAMLNGKGITSDDDRHGFATRVLGREVATYRGLSKVDATALIDELKKAPVPS